MPTVPSIKGAAGDAPTLLASNAEGFSDPLGRFRKILGDYSGRSTN